MHTVRQHHQRNTQGEASMSKARNVSFLNAFRTMAEAEDQLAKLADPGLVIQLWKPDQTLFTVCTQSAIDSLQEELNEAKKEKQA
jgi:hypothetical protein